jgi:Uma2 family endonuclease
MGLAQSAEPLDFPAYLNWEAAQEGRHEYHLGEVFAMVGARIPHNTVLLNIAAVLKAGLRGTPCRTHIDGTKLRIEAADAVLYPDVMVSCDVRDRGPEDRFLCHPVLVVEVLSDATAAYDRGPKFALYRQLESLREYVLVDVDLRRVEAFRLGADGHWVLHDFTGKESVEFASVGQNVPMTMLFEDVDLPLA